MQGWLVFGLLGISISASAEVYRWVDSEGKTHYGDRAPQSQVKSADKLDIKNAPAAPDPQAEEARRQLRQLEEGRQRETAYEAQKAAEQQQRQQQRELLARRCRELRNDILTEQRSAVMYNYDDAGNRVLLTSEQRLAYKEKLQNLKQQNCADIAE